MLLELEDTTGPGTGCTFCGGLGHRITDCPKMEANRRKQEAGKKDYVNGAGGDY